MQKTIDDIDKLSLGTERNWGAISTPYGNSIYNAELQLFKLYRMLY